MTAADGRRWWFDSGAAALDFAYTGTVGDQPPRETLSDSGDLASWFTQVDIATTDRDLIDAKALRSTIARAAVAVSRGEVPTEDDIDVINLFAATPDIPPVLAGGRKQAGRTRARLGQALSSLARECVELFSPEQSDRIRECAASDCAYVFYDESRSNNRRWCSMQRCGNRAKVRTHRAKGFA
jgi:predicted RNA-binding Zn ribbon-like protein